MNRRVIVEYLKQKESERIENEINLKKQKLQNCYFADTPLPTNLKKDAEALITEIIYAVRSEGPQSKPRIILTTSRTPSSMLRAFAKRVALVFNASLLSRGSFTREEISDYCLETSATALIVIEEAKGKPTSIMFSFFKSGPTFYFCIESHEINKTDKKFSSNVGLIFDAGETKKVGVDDERIKAFICMMFPTHKEYRRYLMVTRNGDNYVFLSVTDKKIDLKIEMKIYKIKKCIFTVESDEWNLSLYGESKNNELIE